MYVTSEDPETCFQYPTTHLECNFPLSTKQRLIFGTNVKSVLMYGSETWRVTKTNTSKLQTFINKCLWNVIVLIQIRWPEMIPNEELWERTGQEQIITEIKRRKWGWIDHTLRKPAKNTRDRHLAGTLKEKGKWEGQGKRGEGVWRKS